MLKSVNRQIRKRIKQLSSKESKLYINFIDSFPNAVITPFSAMDQVEGVDYKYLTFCGIKKSDIKRLERKGVVVRSYEPRIPKKGKRKPRYPWGVKWAALEPIDLSNKEEHAEEKEAV